MLLPSVVLLALLVVGVILVVRALASGRGSEPGTGTRRDALRILEERYARGEIDEREFEERRRTLRSEAGEK
ncbi:MAG: SHOCT domain-containing protein [Actinomycetota bacterium]